MNRKLLFASALTLVLTAAAQQSREQFSIATLNVDGMPQKILFFNVNADGPGSAGSVRIGQYLSERQYDMVFTQEDFNYHDELTVLLEDDYQIDTWTGNVGVEGHQIDFLHPLRVRRAGSLCQERHHRRVGQSHVLENLLRQVQPRS